MKNTYKRYWGFRCGSPGASGTGIEKDAFVVYLQPAVLAFNDFANEDPQSLFLEK
jgi:hypothetical protein